VLDPVDADSERDHATVLAEVHPVDHQRHQIQRRQIRGEQLGQGGLGRGDEPARHRRLGGGGGGLLDTDTDGFQPDRVAAGREPCQHPLHRHSAQCLGVGEQLIRRHRQFSGAATGAHPRPFDRHPTPTQAHRTGLVTVPGRRASRVVATLRPAHRGHIGLHHRGHHL
jgi:hypothetical protein